MSADRAIALCTLVRCTLRRTQNRTSIESPFKRLESPHRCRTIRRKHWSPPFPHQRDLHSVVPDLGPFFHDAKASGCFLVHRQLDGRLGPHRIDFPLLLHEIVKQSIIVIHHSYRVRPLDSWLPFLISAAIASDGSSTKSSPSGTPFVSS